MFPRLYALENCKDCYVADKLMSSVTSSFRRTVRGGAKAQQLSRLLETPEPVILSNMEDRWVWDMNGDGSAVGGIWRDLLSAPIPIGSSGSNLFEWDLK
ncbi:hypothetical protein Tco_1514372 [Tanacetum coccineum]